MSRTLPAVIISLLIGFGLASALAWRKTAAASALIAAQHSARAQEAQRSGAGRPEAAELQQVLTQLADNQARVAEQADRLQGLVSEAVSRANSESVAPAIPDVRAPAGAAAATEQAAAIADLRERLERIEAKLESSDSADASTDLARLKESHPEPNWDALNGLIHQWNVDERGARASTQLLGYTDLLTRFGSPTQIWGKREELNWLYAKDLDPFTDKWQLEVWFQLVDGFVVQIGVKQPGG